MGNFGVQRQLSLYSTLPNKRTYPDKRAYLKVSIGMGKFTAILANFIICLELFFG